MKKTTLLAWLLAMVFLSMPVLAACGEKEKAAETPTSPIDIAAVSIETLMNQLRTESASGGFSLDSFLGLDAAVLHSRQSILDVALTNPEADSAMNYRQSAIIAANDEAAFEMEMDNGEEAYRSGVYFSGNEMLVRFADVNKPMIRYALSDDSAAALAGQPPLKRYMACLAAPDPGLMLGGGWESQWAQLAGHLGENLTDADIEQGEMELMIQDQSLSIATYHLQLAGKPATDSMRCCFDAWNGDADVRSFICLADNVAERESAQTTLSLLEAAMLHNQGDDWANSALALTIGMLNDTPVYLDLLYALPQGEFALTMTFWGEGKAKQTEIRLRTLDGSGFNLRDQNRDGGDVFNQETVQTLYRPGGVLAATNTLTADNIYESGGLSKTFSNTYRLIDADDGEESLTVAAGEYAHTDNNGEINGVFSGRLTMDAQDSDPMIMNYSGKIFLSGQAGQVKIPEFIAGSGREISDHPALLAALLKDQASAYGPMPYSQQMMLATMALMLEIDDD
ncbi:MAG: hypothetical protein GX572_02965 [Clostridia bacterium]|nr:hypothetical protein [Clostridia bacterium]